MFLFLRHKKHPPIESMLVSSPYDTKILTQKRLFVMNLSPTSDQQPYLIDRDGNKVAEILVMDNPDNKCIYGYGAYVLVEKKMSKRYQKKAGTSYPVYYANVYIYNEKRKHKS